MIWGMIAEKQGGGGGSNALIFVILVCPHPVILGAAPGRWAATGDLLFEGEIPGYPPQADPQDDSRERRSRVVRLRRISGLSALPRLSFASRSREGRDDNMGTGYLKKPIFAA